jgi:hypothetical protein
MMRSSFQSNQDNFANGAKPYGDTRYAYPGTGVALHSFESPMPLAELAGGAGMGKYRSDFRELYLPGVRVAAQV